MTWQWPLVIKRPEVPIGDHPGAFGAVRKHDVHTGVDLYCSPGTPVVAVEAGTVIAVEHFTGPKAGSPWWNDTMAVLIEGQSGVVLYGEIDPWPGIAVGVRAEPGMLVGQVHQVLKKDKGRPMCMLHLELYAPGTANSVWWAHGEPQPRRLLDPTPQLLTARAHV